MEQQEDTPAEDISEDSQHVIQISLGNPAEVEDVEAGPSGSTKEDEGSQSDNSDVDDELIGEYEVIPDNLTEDYEVKLEENLSKEVKVRKKKKHRTSKIPIHLKGLMGQANIYFAQNQYELTEKMCFEVIRQVPMAWEPYLTLSQIYETSHPEKSMQYLTIAAHLQPSCVYNWIRLAEMNIDNNNFKQAVTCYTNAVAADSGNVELHAKRIELLERLDDKRFVHRCKFRMLNLLSPEDSTRMMALAKEIAEKYHSDNEYQKAMDAITVPFQKCPSKITMELVNYNLELSLLTKNYTNCIDIFVAYCNIAIEIVLDEDSQVKILSYFMPEDLLIDLRIKFIVCMIKMEAFDLLDGLLKPLLCMEDIEDIGDLFLDVAEALMQADKHIYALQLLVPLVKSKNFSLAAVWLKHAECLNSCGMDEQAIESYFNVMHMAPQHTDVRLPLAELLLKFNRIDDAIQVLTQDPQTTEIDMSLIGKKLELLLHKECYVDYYNTILFMLSRHCIILKKYEDIRTVIYLDDYSEKIARIKKMREILGEPFEEKQIVSIREPSFEEEYIMFKKALNLAYRRRDYLYLQEMAMTALSSLKFKAVQEDVYMMAYYGSILNKDFYHAYSLGKEILFRNRTNNMAWNLFSVVTQNLDDTRHFRYLSRITRLHESDCAKLLLGMNGLPTTNTKVAMLYLVPFLQRHPTPFLYLLLCMVFIQISKRKIAAFNKKDIMQIIYAFILSYSNTRSKEATQEIEYNLGRLYHQYGLIHIAKIHYEKVLQYTDKNIEKYPHILDLKREAAFNLHLIYKDSRNYAAARNLLMKYIVV